MPLWMKAVYFLAPKSGFDIPDADTSLAVLAIVFRFSGEVD